MQIRIYPLKEDGTPTGGPPFTITGSLPEEYPADGSIKPDHVSEVTPLVRGDVPGFHYRGNESRALEFSLRRTWKSASQANTFWLDHAEQVPPLGRVELTIIEPTTGQQVAVRRMARATIKVSDGTFKGKSSTFKYSITGGRITV